MGLVFSHFQAIGSILRGRQISKVSKLRLRYGHREGVGRPRHPLRNCGS